MQDASQWTRTSRPSSSCGNSDPDFSILCTRQKIWFVDIRYPDASATFTLSCLFLLEADSPADTSPLDVSHHESFPRR